MTDERTQRPRRPQPGDGPDLRPRPYQPGVPSEPDATGQWTPSWDDDEPPASFDDQVTRHYYVPPASQRGAPPPYPPGRFGRHHDPETTDVIPRMPPGAARAVREPELMTHREPLPPPVPPPPRHPTGPPPAPAGPEMLTPEQAAALKRATRWRRIRRIGYGAAAGFVLIPILIFAIGYASIDVPSFAAVANRQQQPVTIYYSDGTTELATIRPAEGNRINVKYEDVPEHVRNAVLAAEDRSFYTNPGFDVKGIARAAWKQLNGEAGGGSGITQQYVKVATQDDEFTLKRKFREVVIASKISRDTPKEQILENYLNIVYFGRQAYGIQAASRAYFGKDVKDLSVSEGALLAGMIQSPSRSDPQKNPERATNRWNFVLDGMASQGWLSEADRAAQQFPQVLPINEAGPGAVTDYRRHIQNQVEAELTEQGIDQATLSRFGGKVITTIDKAAQDKAVEAVNKVLEGKPENLHASLVAVDPKNGAVRAYFGGKDGTGYDLAGGVAWQPGSSFKPFVMLAALEQDIGLGATYSGKSPLKLGGDTFNNSESSDYGELALKKAMTYSVNTAFVALANDVGPEKVADAAHRAGIPEQVNDKPTLVNRDGTPPGLAIALGAYEVRTIDMAAAYATFAAQGTKNDPFFVQEYIGADNESRYQRIEKPQPAFDPNDAERNAQLACNVTDSMVDVAAYSKFPLAGGRQSASKTGTAQRTKTGGDNANTWTAGYTPAISAAVWVGDPAQTALKLGNRNVFGATVAGPIWKAFMDAYLADKPKETFPKCKPIGKKEVVAPVPPAATRPAPTTAPTTTPTPEPTTTSRPTRPTRPTTTDPLPTCGGIFQPPCPTTTTGDPGPPGRG